MKYLKTFNESIQNKQNELIIVRGPSGSGKTTYVKKHFPNYKNYEADMYFYKNGQYNFNPEKLPEAHKWCLDQTKKELEKGNNVVVSNTFIEKWELEPYLELAKKLNVPYKIYRMTGKFKNLHGVPDEVVDGMRKRIEDIDGEIIVK
jgi:predicted kinase